MLGESYLGLNMGIALIEDLDKKLSNYSTRLRDDLGIDAPASLKLATTIISEIRALPLDKLPTLSGESPLSLKDRHDALHSALRWLEETHGSASQHGQIIV